MGTTSPFASQSSSSAGSKFAACTQGWSQVLPPARLRWMEHRQAECPAVKNSSFSTTLLCSLKNPLAP